jgi:hypothetical protein
MKNVKTTFPAAGRLIARKDKRYPCITKVVFIQTDNANTSVYGQVTEISKSGVRILLGSRLELGAIVRFELGPICVIGNVVRCSPGPGSTFTAAVYITYTETSNESRAISWSKNSRRRVS